jgi:carboxyl-terminal processing protease
MRNRAGQGLAWLVAAALSSPAALAQGTDCSVTGQNLFVRNTLQDIYLWYRELPDPNPALFASPEAYLEAVRYQALDSSFSYVTEAAASDAFFSDSQFIGFGFGTKLLAADDLRVTEVYPDGSAAEAGLRRGHRIVEINGRTVADLVATGELGSAFGPSEVGVTGRLRYRDLAGTEVEITMTKRLVTIPTVSATRVYDVGGRRVGYVILRNFVQPSSAALDEAFAQLAASGAGELVLDLRYNGGGLVSVAQHLAGLIGGARTATQVFTRFVHNDKNTFRDSTALFPLPPAALGLDRVVVITTRSSASASELVVNALRPFLPVTVVGDTTYGKPVGQYGFRFCSKILYPVAFTARNAAGEGDFFGGIPADCPAPDDVDRAFGDPEEGSLAAALHYLANGTCSLAAGARARAQAGSRALRQPHHADGWRQLVGAF